MTRWTGGILIAVLTAGFLIFASMDLVYLVHGYSIGASFENKPVVFNHVSFPIWLQVAHGVVFASILATLMLCVRRSSHAVMAGCIGLAATVPLFLCDAYWYGTVATPGSLKTLLLIAAIAALAGPLARRRG